MRVTIYTDGSCLGNPGPGGYAAILLAAGREKVVSGNAESTTNNRMELRAAIAGLQALTRDRVAVTLVSDSLYVLDLVSGQAKAKANRDLVSQLLELAGRHDVRVRHVRGHAGHPINERVDAIARAKAMEVLR